MCEKKYIQRKEKLNNVQKKEKKMCEKNEKICKKIKNV